LSIFAKKMIKYMKLQKLNLILIYCILSICVLSIKVDGQAIVRSPYLQMATPTSIIVKWRTDLATGSKVSFGLSSTQLSNVVSIETNTTEHEVKLSGLQPNTVYYYNVGTTYSVLQGDNSHFFKTAPLVGSTQPIRIWVMGDMGDGSDNQKKVRDTYLSYIGNDNRKTDMVLLLGDNAYPNGMDNEYQVNFFDMYQSHFLKNNVLWAVPGNHEYYAASRTSRTIPYYSIFTLPKGGEAGGVPSGSESYYSFDYGNVHFIALDSDGIEENQYRLYDTISPQVNWLKRDLAAKRQPWTIVMFHHPPHTKNSHDSDAEEELALIRQNITPILERYKVDVVLSGHSHIYERSVFIKGYKGSSNTFMAGTHAVSSSTGRYDGVGNSCAYVKKNDGIIYAVVGSAGRDNGVPGPWHPMSAFADQITGGSLVLEIENNRLDGKWIASTGSIKDQFTVFKDVNKQTSLSTDYGTTIKLTPSWKGSYNWPDGSKGATYSATITKDLTITVRDDQNCLADQFTVRALAVPTVTTIDLANPAICLGSSVSLAFTTSSLVTKGRTFTAQLSDLNGNFTNPTVIGSGTSSPVVATIPATATLGFMYRLRVVTDTASVTYVPSSAIILMKKPTAIISGGATINVGDSTNLNIAFTGNGPWTYTLTNANTGTTSVNPLIGTVKPIVTTTYVLASVSNICGAGTVSGSAIVTVVPQISTATLNIGNACVGSNLSVPFVVTGAFATAVTYTAQISDATGSFANPVAIGTGSASPITATLPLTSTAGSGYRIRVVASTVSTAINSTAFIIKTKPTATISGVATINIDAPATLTVNFTGDAPWSYVLSDGTTGTSTTSRTVVSVKPVISTTYSITSIVNGCGAGTASGSVKITVVPRISVAALNLGDICVGASISVPFVLAGMFESTVTYTAQLSDANGIFTNPVNIGTGAISPIVATIPVGSAAAVGYKVRVIASANATSVVSQSFNIKPRPTASISGNQSIDFGNLATISLAFTGSSPWAYNLSDGTTGTADRTPFTVNVTPDQTKTYTLSKISNICGDGTGSGSAAVVVVPRLVTESLPAFICAGSTTDVKFGLGGILPANTIYQIQLSDSTGQFGSPIVIGTGSVSPVSAIIPVSTVNGNNYRMRVVAINTNTNTTPSSVFIVRKKATGTLTGGGITIKPSEEAVLVIQATGDAPWVYTLSDNTTGTSMATPIIISVFPIYPTTYTIKSISNYCGLGTVSGMAVVNVLITSIDNTLIGEVKLYPNPTQNKTILNIKLTQPQDGEWLLINTSGQVLSSKHWQQNLSYEDILDTENMAIGTYILKIRVGKNWTIRKLVKN
jgi:acid phosphatase type 7